MPFDVRELADGSYILFWRTGLALTAQRFAANGSAMGDLLTPQAPLGTVPEVAVLADVGFALAWSAIGTAADTDVFTQRFIEVLSTRKKACLESAKGLRGHERKAFMAACLA